MIKESRSVSGIKPRSRPRWKLCAAMLLAIAVMLWAGAAMAVFVPPSSSQFDITGPIGQATLDLPGDALAGGTIVVNGQTIIVPRNIIVLMPANALTWQEVFTQAPPPYGPTSTGLALLDTPTPLTTYQAHVVGNRVVLGGTDRYIAGTIAISPNSLNSGQGYINFIDYVNGELRVGGVIGDPTTGTRVRINDPKGRFGRINSPDVRFTIDEDNPTIRTTTAFPMCLPRTDPGVSIDPLCPAGNRPPLDGDLLFPPGRTFKDPALVVPGVDPDPRIQMPFEISDYITYSGIRVTDNAAAPTAGPMPVNGSAGTYVSAYAITNNLAIYTAAGKDPAYVAIDVLLLGTGGAGVPGLTEAAKRTRFEGFTTDPSRMVSLWAIDINPCTGATTDRFWGTIDIDQGPLSGVAKGRWRFRPPNTVLTLPPGGVFLPPASNLRAVVDNGGNGIIGGPPVGLPANPVIAANGLRTGQYFAPFFDFIFPENIIGAIPPPNNFETFEFLAYGSGPWPGSGPNPIPGGFVGQLSPWPGDLTLNPILIANPNCPAIVPQTPTANAGAPQTVGSGALVTLDGSLSFDPAGLPLAFSWTQIGTPAVILSGPLSARPTFTAPTVLTGNPPVTLTFQLIVREAPGGPFSLPVTTTVTVNAQAAAALPPVANAGVPRTVASGAVVQLNGTLSSDPNAPPLQLTYSWSQIGGPAVTNFNGTTTASPTFTAPIVTPNAVPITFQLIVTNSALVPSAPSTVTVTVNPTGAPVAIAGANQTVLAGSTVTLDGTASFDPAGHALTYAWTQVSGPVLNIPLTGATTSKPTFTAPATLGVYGFNLVVNNGTFNSAPSLVTVTVSPGDSVAISAVVYRLSQSRLKVQATSSDPNAILVMDEFTDLGCTVSMSAPWINIPMPVVLGVPTADVRPSPEPQCVKVRSNLGGSATSPITRIQ